MFKNAFNGLKSKVLKNTNSYNVCNTNVNIILSNLNTNKFISTQLQNNVIRSNFHTINVNKNNLMAKNLMKNLHTLSLSSKTNRSGIQSKNTKSLIKYSKFNFSSSSKDSNDADFSAFDDFYGGDSKIGSSNSNPYTSNTSNSRSFSTSRERSSSYGDRDRDSNYSNNRDNDYRDNSYRDDRNSYGSGQFNRRGGNSQFQSRRDLDDKLSNPDFQPKFNSLKKIDYTPHSNTPHLSEEHLKNFYEENLISLNSKDKSPIPSPIMCLDHLNIDIKILSHLKAQFTHPTPIQSLSWPIALSGSNMVGVAETGSGKTLGFLLPALFHIKSQFNPSYPKEGPIALIIAPTRELAIQINSVALEYAKMMKFRSACLYGGAPRGDQIRTVVYGVELIVATPGRLLDLVTSGKTNLNRVSFIVLDEADRMLDMGFEKDLRRILSMVHPDCQTLMWSATWPKEILKLAEEFLKNYVQMKLGKSENGLAVNKRILQKFIFCEERDKFAQLKELLASIYTNEAYRNENGDTPKVIIFSNYKMKCDRLVNSLFGGEYKIDSIHGDKTQVGRDIAIGKFKKGIINILVATDVAARGLDINDVKVIINFDFPNNLEDYVHRIGRTGRSGKTGTSVSFLTRSDTGMVKNLRSLLVKAEQEIPQEFDNYDHSSQGGGKGNSRRKFGGGSSSRGEGSRFRGTSEGDRDGERRQYGGGYEKRNRSADGGF